MSMKLYENRYYRCIISALLVFATLLALTFNMEIVQEDFVNTITTSQSVFIRTLVKLEYSLNGYHILWLILTPILFSFYRSTFFVSKKNRGIGLPSILFSIFMVFGNSFEKAGNWDLVFADTAQLIKSFISMIGYYAFFYVIIYQIFQYLEGKKVYSNDAASEGISAFIFDKKPFLAPFLIILILWAPYFIAHFPGLFMYDTSMQILQSYNIEDSTAKYLNLISENVKLNNHHPVIHTLILGGCVKLGQSIFKSENIGYFIYTLIQTLISVMSISYSISYMTKKEVPYWFRSVTLSFYCFMPAFQNFAVLGTKDTLFTCMMLLYVINLVEIVENPEKVFKDKMKLLYLFFILITCTLLRNNGIYIILLSLPIIILIHRKYLKQVVLIGMGVFIIFYSFNNILLPSLQITGGSVRESLSIPFQQTARYVRDFGNEVTEEEKEAINAILNYDLLTSRYNPDLSDPVKKLFNESSDREDLSKYFKVWLQMLFKHPGVYIQATINNVYGYFYFSEGATPIYTWEGAQNCMNTANEKGNFNFSFIDSLEPMRIFYHEYSEMFKRIPGLSLLHSCSIYSWILILGIAFAVRRRDYRYLLAYTPLIITLLFCIMSPSNGNRYFRYIYPIAYCLPVVLGIQLYRLSKKVA